ncbi:M1 family metallopeptidase [Flavobacterium luteum]|uniref:Aminopeptidase N n=1 Tax=Flavobacterium luteum TaxID=2026654 RepID=A0A7J5AFD7_9FLAO|nr:M1 family aminopeptidase [Flavobacterium luteum]KAB1156168.1 peptidase M1 [Flavobacterium luteum]
MKFFYCFISLVFTINGCLSQSNKKQTVLLEKGVSKELACFRKHQINDVSYELSFSIPLEKSESILSNLILNLTLTDLSQPLYLDFNEKTENIKSIQANGTPIAINHQKEHLLIASENLKLGRNTIAISFVAGNSSLNRNDAFLYTLLVPDRASTLFPCFDQPDLKAVYTLTITAPKEWKVLCASPLNNKIAKGDFITYSFDESDKMSTYLFSFVAGEFKSVAKKSHSSSSTFLYRENDAEKIKESTDVIFKQHEQAVTFLEDYTLQKFPFKKLDFVAIPSFQYGGMEHVGAIQYSESDLFLDTKATESEKLERAKLIAHETAHMWFGDLVTMKWFDDVWMKEVFANFMADKIVNPLFPEVNHDLQFLTSHYPSAYAEDRTAGTNPIKQNLENLKNAGSLYGNIIYDKAPIMMRQLEMAMGEKAFRKGIQKYIQKFANKNADWNDLIAILDYQTSLNLNKWSDVWVEQSGRPIFSETIEYDNDNRIKKFEIIQNAEDASNNIWPQLFEIGFVYNDSTKILPVTIKGKTTTLLDAMDLPKPISIIYNYNGYGYGVFPVDKTCLDSIASIQSEVARASSFINLYENTLLGTISPLDAFNANLKSITIEQNELIINVLSSQINTLFWKYLTEKQQQVNQKIISDIIYNRLQENLPSNIKKTLFGLLSAIAYSETDKERLYQIWNKEIVINNLKLNEDDYTNIAMDLVIFNHPKSAEIITKTKQSISNPDKQKRFDYLLPSLSNEEAVRDTFVESLKEEKNRENESWVLSSLKNIYHPLRQESAKKHLKSALYLTDDIQRTGDIFFPKAWLSNSIGRYSSIYAFEVVETFLKENPNFSPILKRKLMQATDGLYRAQKIKKETE